MARCKRQALYLCCARARTGQVTMRKAAAPRQAQVSAADWPSGVEMAGSDWPIWVWCGSPNSRELGHLIGWPLLKSERLMGTAPRRLSQNLRAHFAHSESDSLVGEMSCDSSEMAN